MNMTKVAQALRLLAEAFEESQAPAQAPVPPQQPVPPAQPVPPQQPVPPVPPQAPVPPQQPVPPAQPSVQIPPTNVVSLPGTAPVVGSKDDLINALQALQIHRGVDAITGEGGVLKTLGVNRISELPDERIQEAIALVQRLQGAA